MQTTQQQKNFYAIVDCNSFYCSCERVFRPDLDAKPVVVLSNNDGCIISRSDEAKHLGVGMAAPYFKNKDIIEQHDVKTFSSNYNLYGDMSRRVMDTLRAIVGEKNVEVYSVDEAFLNLSHIPFDKLNDVAYELKETVEMWTGIKVSVGVASTKVLSKVANRLSKKNKIESNCVMVLDTPYKIEQALKKTAIEDVWGIGFQYAEKLKRLGIYTAFDLSICNMQWAAKKLGGITGLRLMRELKGEHSIAMRDELEVKKMIMTTRMFGTPVTEIKDIKEAVATYTSRAAEKLRRQDGAAQMISVFLVPKEPTSSMHFRHGYTRNLYTILPVATSLTNELIKPALQLVDQLFEDGKKYKKAGVTLSRIVLDESIQGNLFVEESKGKGRFLMNMIDNVNFAMRNDVLKFASSGTDKNWKMQQNFISPRYTSRWHELCEVK
jgi:DNA polymerase V